MSDVLLRPKHKKTTTFTPTFFPERPNFNFVIVAYAFTFSFFGQPLSKQLYKLAFSEDHVVHS